MCKPYFPSVEDAIVKNQVRDLISNCIEESYLAAVIELEEILRRNHKFNKLLGRILNDEAMVTPEDKDALVFSNIKIRQDSAKAAQNLIRINMLKQLYCE